MDEHFRAAPLEANAPVLLALAAGRPRTTYNLGSDEPVDLLLAREDGGNRPADLEQDDWRKSRNATLPRDASGRPELFEHSPRSFVPRHSPDLGVPASPLAPSIGPGSGLLGPEGGRSPSRLRLELDPDRGRDAFKSR